MVVGTEEVLSDVPAKGAGNKSPPYSACTPSKRARFNGGEARNAMLRCAMVLGKVLRRITEELGLGRITALRTPYLLIILK